MRIPPVYLAAVVALAGMTSSCSSSGQTRKAVPTGFLTNYERLGRAATGSGEVWRAPEFNIEDYEYLVVAPVELWLGISGRGDLAEADARRLTSLFRTKVIQKLQDAGWNVIPEPVPPTVRTRTALTDEGWVVHEELSARTGIVRLALTELGEASRTGSVVASLPIVSTIAVETLSLSSELAEFVGGVSTELQIVDATDRKILIEAMDRRAGTHSVENFGSTWGDVEDAMDHWSSRIAVGLAKPEKGR